MVKWTLRAATNLRPQKPDIIKSRRRTTAWCSASRPGRVRAPTSAFKALSTSGSSFVSLGAGGAIVTQSSPEAEWEEVLVKARPVIRAVECWLRPGDEAC